MLFIYQSKLYNCVLARNIRIKTKAPVKLTGALLLGLAKSIYYNSTRSKGLIHTNFLTWSGIRSAIPVHLKTLNVEESEIPSLNFQCGEKIFDPVSCKSKQFYELLISKKTVVSRGFTKLKDDFDLDDITVSKVFLNLKAVSSETFVRSFQFKFLDDIIYTNVRCLKGHLYIL